MAFFSVIHRCLSISRYVDKVFKHKNKNKYHDDDDECFLTKKKYIQNILVILIHCGSMSLGKCLFFVASVLSSIEYKRFAYVRLRKTITLILHTHTLTDTEIADDPHLCVRGALCLDAHAHATNIYFVC